MPASDAGPKRSVKSQSGAYRYDGIPDAAIGRVTRSNKEQTRSAMHLVEQVEDYIDAREVHFELVGERAD